MKRILATLLVLTMLLGVFPAAVAAEPVADPGRTAAATELAGQTRLNQQDAREPDDTWRPATEQYAADDRVTVIVELAEDAVLHNRSDFSGSPTVGAAVSRFLSSGEARAKQAALLSDQEAVLSAIGRQAQVVAQWTNVVNGFAIEVPYGKLENIRNLDGVKRAYVQHVYDRPEVTVYDDAMTGVHGYSYDMVDLKSAWEAGFTGQGMLVAVLDTGLDLQYGMWGDSANPEVGIRRVHQAFSDDSFLHDPDDAQEGWTLRYTNESLRIFLETTALFSTTGIDGKITWDNNALYKNRKVPYACDYADLDMNVMPLESDHGTHVSGTVAGYAETEDGEVIFSGVAPDAQLLSMKVFPDASGGAQEISIISALEDAALLGADVMNLSLGSDNGFAEDDSLAGEVYDRLNATGIVFMVSAGNAGHSSALNHYGDFALTSDPEISMVSSPSLYAPNLSVASIENTVTTQTSLKWFDTDGTETKIAYQDPTDIAMKYKFVEQEPVNVIPVDGYGTYDDYYNAGFRGYYGYGEKGVEGIALVKRGGGISFVDKINAATNFTWSYYDPAKGYYVTEYPIKAVIIYDEDPNSTGLIYMSTEGAALTSCYISGKDGAALAEAAKAAMEAGSYVTLRVLAEDDIVPSVGGGQMSVFSSWGAGPSLELKPEITAPGGNIWSALSDTLYNPADPGGRYDDYEGSYGMMSGTSMAAPHMTGITALVEQYIQKELGVTAKSTVGPLAQQLMVSTAIPQKDARGVYNSPRQQGAGLVNVGAAISTPVYITVEGQNVGKLELKDDPERTGSYTMTFHVHNLTNRQLTYQVTAAVLRPDTQAVETTWGERSVMTTSEVLMRQVDFGTVTVPASGNVKVTKTLTLTEQEKEQLDLLFENGTYVEGFITLTDTEETAPQIGLPFLAYYGDWTAAPIFDSALWTDVPADGQSYLSNESTWGTSVLAYFDGYAFYDLGQNPFDSFSDINQKQYHPENITLSPNGLFRSINDYILYQKREAKVMVVEVRDASTGQLYYRDHTAYMFKSYYDQVNGMVLPSSLYYFTNTDWDGTGLDGELLPTGTQCIYTITAYGDGDYPVVYDETEGRQIMDLYHVIPGENEPTFNGHAMDMTGDTISFPVLVDYEAPSLRSSAVSIKEVDGRLIMTGTFEDDGSLASIEIYPQVARSYAEGYGDPNYKEYGMDQINPFYSEMIYDADVHTWTFTADVTEYVRTNESFPGENTYYNFEWTGNVYIFGGDYGGNDRAYAVTVDATSGLILSTTSALLTVGETFDLSVNNNTDSEAELTRTSTRPEVATIDEYGHVVAVAPGQTTLVISNGTQEAVCIVAVRERVTEVEDFSLSIESFSGLKPGGTMIVKVTDLKPANVELEEVRWVVTEDNPDQYVGLINCAQYDTTGLIGELYLNYNATSDPEIEVPGASGTLSVTLNGVTRTMKIDWEDLYTYSSDDDLVSNLSFYDQTLYVTQGETATLHARYNNASLHSMVPVALYTLEGYVDYSYDNVLEPAKGLKLDGPDFCSAGNIWSGKLVNEAGYDLPERIRIFTRYDYGYEYEMQNSWRTEYTYNNQTGEIQVFFPPEAATSTMVIRADGVDAPGKEAGAHSGITYPRPDGLYGPFDWEVVSGSGTLTTQEDADISGTKVNVAHYVPAEPGCSIIKATTRDGKYSVNFAVISQAVLPEKVEISHKRLTLRVAETAALTTTLTPTPTLEKHGELKWVSYDPQVASVDASGNVTALAAGYAFLTVTSPYTGAMSYCIVEVLPCEHEQKQTITVPATCETDGSVTVVCQICGEVISEEILPMGHDYDAIVTDPTCTEGGYTTYICKVCQHSYVADYTEPMGHQFKDTVTAPTCLAEGYTRHDCYFCGYYYVDEMLPATGHDWSEWETIVAPTCEISGLQIHTCADCDAAETREIPAFCPAENFTDVDTTKWYHEGVCYVIRKGLMEGKAVGIFAPEVNLSRAELVTVLYRMAGEPSVEGKTHPFKDVSADAWYAEAVTWAYNAGVVEGMSGTAFAPGRDISREQIALILFRYSGAEKVEENALKAYTDASSVSNYAVDAMNWAVATGLINGTTTTTLAPRKTALRAQAATILMRYCEN